jgi:hypothetical protein
MELYTYESTFMVIKPGLSVSLKYLNVIHVSVRESAAVECLKFLSALASDLWFVVRKRETPLLALEVFVLSNEISQDYCKLSIGRNVKESLVSINTYYNKERQRTYVVTLWCVRFIFIPPRLS